MQRIDECPPMAGGNYFESTSSTGAGMRRILKSIDIRLFLVATFATMAFASDSFSQIVRRGVFSGISDIQSRVAQLNPPDKDIPEADQMLYEEARRLDEEMRDLRSFRPAGDSAQELAQLEAIKKEISPLLGEVPRLECAKVKAASLRNISISFSKINSFLSRKFFNEDIESPQPNPWGAAPWQSSEKPQYDKGYCEDLKTFIGDSTSQQTLLGYFDKLVAVINQEKKAGEDNKKSVDGLMDLLQKRKNAVQAKLNAKSTQQQIGSSLWLVILVIGGLSVGAILAVKLFESEIQMEWVASGQVIQFVTVMVLLCVVMALGLANILKENTLGTLLGGIAGYVLAQGVGRAAAREAQRDRKSNPTKPPE